MVARMPPSSKEIIELLSRLKLVTPEYPANLLATRKAAFIKQAATLGIQGKGQGGEGGQDAGGSGSGGTGTALGGTTTAQGIALQALIGLGLVATILIGMFTGTYLIRNEDIGRPDIENNVAMESPGAVILPVPSALVIPTEVVPVIATPEIIVTGSNPPIIIDVEDDLELLRDLPKDIKDNPGLHLGQTPGTPAAPGHGNPGNINKPDKPDNPNKPDRPGRP